MFKRVDREQTLPTLASLPKVKFRELNEEFQNLLGKEERHTRGACAKMATFVSVTSGVPILEVYPSDLANPAVALACIEYGKSRKGFTYHCRRVYRCLGTGDLMPSQRKKFHLIHPDLLDWFEVVGFDKRTESNIRSSCMRFLTWLSQNYLLGYSPHTVPLLYLQRQHLVAYKRYLLKSVRRRERCHTTASAVMHRVMVWIRWMKETGKIGTIDTSGLSITHGENQTRRIATYTQISRFMEVIMASPIDNAYKVYFLLLISTGARPNEIQLLKRKHVDDEKRSVYLNSKNGPGRWIPLSPNVWNAVSKHIQQTMVGQDGDVTVLRGTTGQPLDISVLNRYYRTFKRTAGVDINGLMAFRHRFATDCYEKKIPVHGFQYLMGHRGLSEMKRYQHENQYIRKAEIEDAFKTMDWVERLNDRG